MMNKIIDWIIDQIYDLFAWINSWVSWITYQLSEFPVLINEFISEFVEFLDFLAMIFYIYLTDFPTFFQYVCIVVYYYLRLKIFFLENFNEFLLIFIIFFRSFIIRGEEPALKKLKDWIKNKENRKKVGKVILIYVIMETIEYILIKGG